MTIINLNTKEALSVSGGWGGKLGKLVAQANDVVDDAAKKVSQEAKNAYHSTKDAVAEELDEFQEARKEEAKKIAEEKAKELAADL